MSGKSVRSSETFSLKASILRGRGALVFFSAIAGSWAVSEARSSALPRCRRCFARILRTVLRLVPSRRAMARIGAPDWRRVTTSFSSSSRLVHVGGLFMGSPVGGELRRQIFQRRVQLALRRRRRALTEAAQLRGQRCCATSEL
jgi:hypothetical protein